MRPVSHARVRRRLGQAESRWSERALSGLLADADLATVALAAERAPSDLAAGSRPQRFFRDPENRRYLFKSAPEEQIGAEVVAAEIRRRGGRPRLPVARRVIDLDDRGPTVGMVQPVIEHAGERLPLQAARWSALQVEAMLQEHPWEWVVGNYDSHIDQYVLVGPERIPFNIDWDHSLLDLDGERPSRHDRRSPAVFPIRNILYDDYVAGIRSLDFVGMQLQARAVTRLADAEVAAAFERCPGLGDDAERARVLERVLRRKNDCAVAFDAFVDALREERAASLRVGPNPRSAPRRAASFLRDTWQRLAIRVLHDRVVRPTLKLKREALDVWDRLGGSSR